MITFWVLFLVPAWAVLLPTRLPERQARWVWAVIGAFFAVLIGFRHEVGADWWTYLGHFQNSSGAGFLEALGWGDPGYFALNWLIARLDGDIYWVNFVCAAILMWGTVVFCRRQPNPWLALLAAAPYLLLVVGMGYTRQSVALGLALLGLSALGGGRVRVFVMCVIVGVLFHKSAVLLLPIAVLAASRNRVLTGLIVLFTTGLTYYLLFADSVEVLWTRYIDEELQSQGGMIRVVMNAVPAAILLMSRRWLVPDTDERRLWSWIALFAMLCIPLVGLASTAVDRIALYLIPLQLFVFSRLPRLAGTTQTRTPLVLAIVGYYATVQFVWLNYATHARNWIPYQFMPIGG